MAGETRAHAAAKGAIYRACYAALDAASSPCRAYVDGLAVVIDESTTFIPDVVVDCSDSADPDDRSAAQPVVVIEVISPSSRRKDLNEKLHGYFQVPSVMHYLVVDIGARRVIHQSRSGDPVNTRFVASGVVSLDPPGIRLDVDAFWRDLPPVSA